MRFHILKVLPAPVLPTIPIFSLDLNMQEMFLRTGESSPYRNCTSFMMMSPFVGQVLGGVLSELEILKKMHNVWLHVALQISKVIT